MKNYKIKEYTDTITGEKLYVICERVLFFFWVDGSGGPGALGENWGPDKVYTDKEIAINELNKLNSKSYKKNTASIYNLTFTTIILMAFWTNFVQSQSIDSTVYSFEGVVKLDSSLTQAALFKQARNWFNENFKSSKSAIEIADKETGEISGKGSFEHTMVFINGFNYADGAVEFMVTINVKPGKYKYVINHFSHISYDRRYADFGTITKEAQSPERTWAVTKSMANKQWKILQDAVLQHGKELEQSLKDYMAKAKPNEDW